MMCWIKWENAVINEVFQIPLSFIAAGLIVFICRTHGRYWYMEGMLSIKW